MKTAKIYIQNWLELKPYNTQTLTDSYYLVLCNKVKKALLSIQSTPTFKNYINNEEIDNLACFLTSYFEDLISDTNIWNSFVKQHTRLYKKQLPFYELEEYFEEEINEPDICFLIWCFLNTAQTNNFISPFNNFIYSSADAVFDIFAEAWEYAPENKLLKSIYTIDKDADFYEARNLIDTLLFKTYLFSPDTYLRLKKKEAEIIKENNDNQNLLAFLNENRDSSLHIFHTRLLSLKGKEWVAEIIGSDHPLQAAYLNMSKKIRGYFLYKGKDQSDIFLEHIASGKKFKLTQKSFDHSDNLNELDTIVFMGIVQWKDEWWFSGVYFQSDFNADLILNERNSIESRMAVNFLDHKKTETTETLQLQHKAFLDFNNGKPIAFMPSDKIEPFVNDYMNFFNNSLKLSDKDIEEAQKRSRKDGYFGEDKESTNFTTIAETGLVFYNPKSGVEAVLAVNSAFPLSKNPFFKKEESEDHIFRMLMDESISTELAMYSIDNCKRKLPFFKEGVGNKFLNDIDFILRFLKHEYYFSIPSITPIGKTDE